MTTKEEIYDTQIHPLMAAIVRIVKEHGIAMVASFNIPNDDDAGLRCTTHLPNGDGVFDPDYQRCASLIYGGRGLDPMAIRTEKADGSVEFTSFI